MRSSLAASALIAALWGAPLTPLSTDSDLPEHVVRGVALPNVASAPATSSSVAALEPLDVPKTAAVETPVVMQIEERFSRYQSGLAPFEVRAVAEAIDAESSRYGLDRHLVLAVIHTESGFHNFARSRVGALGLMQIMPPTGRMLADDLGIPWRGPETLFDPVVNVRLGTRYLAYLFARYDTWDGALAAYNWGPGAIDQRLRDGHSLPVLYSQAVLSQLERDPVERGGSAD